MACLKVSTNHMREFLSICNFRLVSTNFENENTVGHVWSLNSVVCRVENIGLDEILSMLKVLFKANHIL